MKFGRFYSQSLNKEIRQVNKKLAKRLFNEGNVIYIQSCNMLFDNVWQSAAQIKNDSDYNFEQIVNNYIYYNCDNYRGKYPCFFIENK